MDLMDRIGIDHPVVQAGMSGVATSALAGAVSAAGGLGTVGLLDAGHLRAELDAAREKADGRPIAANLLLPFTKRPQVDAVVSAGVRVATLHGGFDSGLAERLREAGVCVLATVGTVPEALEALAGGAEGLVVQGNEAGGHLVGVEPALNALEKVQQATGSRALLVAGGIADGADTRRALDAGAAAVVAGTRFLLTHESRAHDGYKQRVLDADRTLETLLFSVGWPMRHRVVPNAATDRWCRHGLRGPRAVVALTSLTRGLHRLPLSSADRLSALQTPWIPLYGPGLALVGMPQSRLDSTALYAGETALRIHEVITAAEAVAQLTPPPDDNEDSGLSTRT